MMRLLRKLGISNKSVESNTRPEGEDQKRKSKGFRFFVLLFVCLGDVALNVGEGGGVLLHKARVAPLLAAGEVVLQVV